MLKTSISPSLQEPGTLAANYHPFLKERVPKAWTGSYADNDLCSPYVCSGWMPLHEDTDYGVTPEQPYFKFRALYWDEDAVLVVTDDNDNFQIVERTPTIVTFNGTKPHGLLPLALAQELVARQDDQFFAYAIFDTLVETGQFTPKLIWEWIPVV